MSDHSHATRTAEPSRADIVDVAIAGGGVAGLYCAWRIASCDSKATVMVFEKDGRVGGRLLTVDFVPESGRKAELGGMRFTDRHLIVKTLVCELRRLLGTEKSDEDPFEVKPFCFDTEAMCLRGKTLSSHNKEWQRTPLYKILGSIPTDKELKDAPLLVMKEALMNALDRMKSSSGNSTNKYAHLIKKLLDNDLTKTALNPTEWRTWQEHATIPHPEGGDDLHVYEIGFWNLLQLVLSESPDETSPQPNSESQQLTSSANPDATPSQPNPESQQLASSAKSDAICSKPNAESPRTPVLKIEDGHDAFLFLHDALGYESLLANSNAAQAIPAFLADFDNPAYSTLSGGMESIPRALAYLCSREDNRCSIAEHHTVDSIGLVDRNGERYFELNVTCTPMHSGADIAYRWTYLARSVILALPQEALRAIRFYGFPADTLQRFERNIGTVTPHPAFKLFLRYDTPWWTENLNGKFEGRVTTDLPIRQVYYMGKEPGSRALVMASYSDEHYVDFWAPLVHDPARESAIGRLRALGLQQGADISGYAAGQRIIHKAKQQLHKIHKNDKALSPSVIGIVKEWKQAWHWWNVHTQPWKVAAEMVKPFGDDIECFTAGEAYSLEQGWVEGALKSAERALMAMSRITMARPDWIGDDEISRHGCLFGDYISH